MKTQPMNRSFYLFGALFLGLSIACGLFQSFIHFQVGSFQFHYLQSFNEWFLVVNIISLIGTMFLLKYLSHKKHWVPFSTGVISAILTFCQLIFTYVVAITVAKELTFSYIIYVLLLSLAAGIVFSLSLLFFHVDKRPWLKIAAIFMILNNLLLGAAFIWGLIDQAFIVNVMFDKIQQWFLLANNLAPLFFLMNFWSELKFLKAEEIEVNATGHGFLLDFTRMLGGIALITAFYLGTKVYHESYWALNWVKKGPEIGQQLANSFEERAYVSSKGDTLNYLFMKPLDYDPKKKYPMVVCLHGGPLPVKSGRVSQIIVTEPAPFLSNPENRKKYPAFLFVPQCPPGSTWGGVPNLSLPEADSLVFEAIGALEQEFEIDEKRRYVAGISMGGFGSWHFIGTRPEMFAAAIPICGEGNPALAKNMVDVPVWAFHGSKDRHVSVRGTRYMIEAIKKAGGNPQYTEFADAAHNIWPQIQAIPRLLDWLFAQKRK
jgi:pimeloyl-ACP methyl ester carboxylesterase